jgi:hypothetical protein
MTLTLVQILIEFHFSPKLSTIVRLVEASENDLKWCKCQDQGQELLLSSIVRKVEFY